MQSYNDVSYEDLEMFCSPHRKSERMLERKTNNKKSIERKQLSSSRLKAKVMLHLCHNDHTRGHMGPIKSESGFISCFELGHYLGSVFDRLAYYYLLEERCTCGTPIRRQERPAVSSVSGTIICTVVLGRLLTANMSDRTSMRANDTTHRAMSFFLLRYVVNISSLERFAKQLKVVIITFFEACALSFVISANRHYPRRYCDTPVNNT